MVFANPASPIWTDVGTDRAFIDLRTGDAWDLFFAGATNQIRYPMTDEFASIERWVHDGHAAAIESDGGSQLPWSYPGGTELVSFMVYGTDPVPDWLSLVSTAMYPGDGQSLNLSFVVEGLRGWENEDLDPRLAPGQVQLSDGSRLLTRALVWSATAIGAEVVGDTAYQLAYDLVALIRR